MDTLILANIVVFFIVSATGMFVNLASKKWIVWLLGAYGFISGSLVGFVAEGDSPSWQLGGIFAISVMYTTSMISWQRQHYKGVAASWLSKYGEEARQPFALLASVIKKLVGQ